MGKSRSIAWLGVYGISLICRLVLYENGADAFQYGSFVTTNHTSQLRCQLALRASYQVLCLEKARLGPMISESSAAKLI